MIVGQDVGEPVLGSVDRQVSSCAHLVAANMLQLLILLAEPEVRVRRHDPVVLSKVHQLDRSGCLDDRVWQADGVSRRTCDWWRVSHVIMILVSDWSVIIILGSDWSLTSSGDVMSSGLVTTSTLEFAENDECEEDDDQEDDGDGDADQDGGVVGVRGDRQRPGGLAVLVSAGVGSNLNMRHCLALIGQLASNILQEQTI